MVLVGANEEVDLLSNDDVVLANTAKRSRSSQDRSSNLDDVFFFLAMRFSICFVLNFVFSCWGGREVEGGDTNVKLRENKCIFSLSA